MPVEGTPKKQVLEEQIDQDKRYATPAEAEHAVSTRSDRRPRMEPRLAQSQGGDESPRSLLTAGAQRPPGMIGPEEEDINVRLPENAIPPQSEESVAPIVAPLAKPS